MQSWAVPKLEMASEARRRLGTPSYVDFLVMFIVVLIMFYFLRLLMKMSRAQTEYVVFPGYILHHVTHITHLGKRLKRSKTH